MNEYTLSDGFFYHVVWHRALHGASWMPYPIARNTMDHLVRPLVHYHGRDPQFGLYFHDAVGTSGLAAAARPSSWFAEGGRETSVAGDATGKGVALEEVQ